MLFKKILVAYDGSKQAKHAVDYASDMANTCGGTLVVLTVVPRVALPVLPEEGYGVAPLTNAQEFEDYQDKLRAMYQVSQQEVMRDIVERFPKLQVEAIFLEGRPSATIVEQAEKNKADLIVMGSRGIGGISGWILGSTSKRVVESCTKPVLVVK